MRYVIRSIAIVCFDLAALQAGPAHAEKRVALVIGNSAYRAVTELPNPKKDARDIAAALRAAAFGEVVERYDLGVREMQQALSQFEDKATGADWAVVYYAGHGIEVDGRNYLVPIDAQLRRATDVEDETLPLDRVLARVAAACKLQLVILDACRFNPFRQRMAGAATRAIGERGLARMEPAHPNVIVAYAARDGQVALDGRPGKNRPCARALVKYLSKPGLELGKFFRKVRVDVLAATGGRQRPFEYGSLTEDLFFKPGVAAGPKPPVALAPPQQSSGAERAWAAAKDSTSIAVLEAFRRQYGAANAFYDRLAEARIDELKRQQLAMLKAEEDRRRAEAGPADASKRVALVIGNSVYAHLAPLSNPRLDARAVADLLKTHHGWEVGEAYDLSFVQLHDAVAEFKGKANGASVALVYYAGHGMSHQNRDFVAPTDMPEHCASDVLKRVISLDWFFQAVEGAQRKIVLLDACRNQAFPSCAKRGSEGCFRGLARVQSSGLLIASATAPGALSDDGAPGAHSPFARVLLDHFRANPSAYFHELLFKVAGDVHRATRKSQTPELVVRGMVPQVCLSADSCRPLASAPEDVAKMR